jgi:hypothetical protein
VLLAFRAVLANPETVGRLTDRYVNAVTRPLRRARVTVTFLKSALL